MSSPSEFSPAATQRARTQSIETEFEQARIRQAEAESECEALRVHNQALEEKVRMLCRAK